MTDSLIDDLDATFREIDQLTDQWEQAQAYQGALTRMRYLAPTLAALVEDVQRARLSLPEATWSRLRATLRSEQPVEFEAIGRALVVGDERFMRIVSYVGFARGALTALLNEGVVASDPVPIAVTDVSGG